jgi:hypothetical protein
MHRLILDTVSQLLSPVPLAISKGDLPGVLSYHHRINRRHTWHGRFPDVIETAAISQGLKTNAVKPLSGLARGVLASLYAVRRQGLG